MIAGLSKLISALELLKDKNGRKVGKKITIIILSPILGIVLLIGGIFSDGTAYNHNLIYDLYHGNSINTSAMDREQREWVIEVEAGIQLIDTELKEETLDPFLVKGYYIGIMLSEQKVAVKSDNIHLWMDSFIENVTSEETNSTELTNRYPMTNSTDIYSNIENQYSIKLSDDTKATIEKVYSGLVGEENGNYPSDTIVTLTEEEKEALISHLPEGTTQIRKDIIIQGADAVGKIPYYWGGVASVPGYDGNDFGMVITADAHGRTLKGLDCSHFVDWVYWTVMGNNLGNTSTHNQITQCDKISESELLPGDLAFLMDEKGVTTHVGIYAGKRDGKQVWIHENAAANNVSMDTVNYWTGYYRLHIMKEK